MAYGDDNVEMLGDDATLLAAQDPLLKQKLLAAKVRQNPALSMPSAGPTDAPAGGDPMDYSQTMGASPSSPQQAGGPAAAGPQPGTYAHTMGMYADTMNTRPDPEPLLKLARTKAEEGNRRLGLGMTLQALGGESMSPTGKLLSDAGIKESGDYDIPGGWGKVTEGGVVWNEEKIREERQKQLLAQANAQLAAETKRQLGQDRNDTLAAIAAGKADKPQRQQRTGVVTPDGETVNFDPVEGQDMVNGQPYHGPKIAQSEFDKQIKATQQAMSGVRRSTQLIESIKANPRAFGGIASIAGYTGQWAGQRIIEKNLTPQERQVRGQVLREAASVINELYGAALTANEERRASGFVPNPADPPDIVMDKLQLALNWANSQASIYGPRIQRAAQSRSEGGAPAAAAPARRPGPPPGAVTREQ